MNPAENSWILAGCCKWHLNVYCMDKACCLQCPHLDKKKSAIVDRIKNDARVMATPEYHFALWQTEADLQDAQQEKERHDLDGNTQSSRN